jgi:hypothetical protein
VNTRWVAGSTMGILLARARGRGAREDLGEDGADRWAPSISDGGAVMGW